MIYSFFQVTFSSTWVTSHQTTFHLDKNRQPIYWIPSNSCFYCVADTNMNTLFVPVANDWHEVDTTVWNNL